MANTVANVTASKPKVGGAAWRAPLGTALPTNATSNLPAAYKGLGYISTDGLKHDINRTNSSTKAWGGDTVLDSETEKNDQYKFTCIEALNDEVLKMAYGDSNVSGNLASGLSVLSNNTALSEAVYVFERILRNGVFKRTVISRGKVIGIEEISEDDSNVTGYAFTLNAYPDASGNTSKDYYFAPSGENGVLLDTDTLTVSEGATATLVALTVPANAAVTWTSSATGKATVVGGTVNGNPVGIVTGVAAGTATITASITVDGTTYTDTCAVTIEE